MPTLPFFAPLLLAVGGGVLYHLAAKSVPRGIDPALVLIGAYTTALCASTIAYFVLRTPGADPLGAVKPWHASVIGIGLGASLIEMGFVLTYRAGWPVSAASVIVNGTVAVLLVPLGAGLFGERFSIARAFGIVLCLIGVTLLRH